MNQANVTIEDRHVVAVALKRAEETHTPAAALELDDGRIITGKTTNLLGASAALLLNVIERTGRVETRAAYYFTGIDRADSRN